MKYDNVNDASEIEDEEFIVIKQDDVVGVLEDQKRKNQKTRF